MQGFYNRVLKINLTKTTYEILPIEDEVLKKTLGGKGLATHLLLKNNPIGVNPLSPDNQLIFATGPTTGGLVWGSSRYGAFTKSPLTDLYAESYSGGRVPEAISATGFDAILIQGKADRLSFLEIHSNGVEYHDASALKGMDTFDTEKAVKPYTSNINKSWKTGAVVIGPAAENGVRFATIKNDGWRCAGRAGTGTVMGAKNLKAILFTGNQKRHAYDKNALIKLSKHLASESKNHPVVHAYKTMGTSQMVKIMNKAGAFPTRYWSKGSAQHWEKISADALHNRCEVKPNACAKCFLSCGRMTKILKGRHKGLIIEGPEYETIYTFGGLCMVESIEEIAWLNHLCDSLGMDTITAGNIAAFAMKAFEQGNSDYNIQFGDADGIADLLHLISERKEIGKTLSKGIRHAAELWGMEDTAVHVKGMEPAGYDPRTLKGMGLAYASSDRGACHLRATFYKPELSGMIEPDQIEGKAKLFIDFEDRLTLFDSLILCKFFRDIYPWELLDKLVTSTTGIDGSKENLSSIAQNIAASVREFNLREGMTKKQEKLPSAFHKPLEDSGAVITETELDKLMQEYKELRKF